MDDALIKNGDLVFSVINEAKKHLEIREQKYIHSTRLNKLVVLISEELEKNGVITDEFVWGYYRHGFFSRTVANFLRLNFGSKFDLSELNFTEITIPEEIINIIVNSLLSLKKYFVMDRERFANWIYNEKTPEEYKRFYLNHKKLEKWFYIIDSDIMNKNFQMDLYGKKSRGISDLISEYYFSLDFVDDLEILEIFRMFTDIIELITLKLDNGAETTKIKMKMDRLSILYNAKILSILAPYSKTLKGEEELIEKEKLNHLKRVQGYKKYLKYELNNIYKELYSEGLVPTFYEMHKEIEHLAEQLPPNSRSLKELYKDIEHGKIRMNEIIK